MSRLVAAEEAKALRDGATEGPWRWYGDTATQSVYLATVDRGRQFVMSFFRWGMRGATPAFRGDGFMETAQHFAQYEVAPDATDRSDPRLYRHDFQGLRHPDARLIAAAPDLAYTVEQQAAQIFAEHALHKPRSIDLITAPECVDEECDHEKCPTESGSVCDHCFRLFENHLGEYATERISDEVLWPCASARALGVEA